MTEDEERKEIIVKAPSKSVVAPEKKAEKATEKALEEERYNVFQIPNKVGKYVGLSSIAAGVSLFVLLAYTSSDRSKQLDALVALFVIADCRSLGYCRVNQCDCWFSLDGK